MSVVNAVFGNAWHGQLGPSSLQLADGTQMVAAPSGSSKPPVPYAGPGFLENIGNNNYYKTPGIGPATTPPAVAAIGGEFKNDAVFFGSNQRYSAFGYGSLGGPNVWLHYGADGKWRKMYLNVVSIGWQSTVVDVVCDDRPFGEINRPAAAGGRLVARLSLPGGPYNTVSDPVLSDLTVRHDGRQIALCLWGKWSVNLGYEDIFENTTARAPAVAWRIDIEDDLSSASASQVWIQNDQPATNVARQTWTEVTGPLAYFDHEGTRYWYQPVYVYGTVSHGSLFVIERLVGMGFSASGTLHLNKFTFKEELGEIWYEEWGYLKRGEYPVNSGFVPTPVVSGPGRGSMGGLYYDQMLPPPVFVKHGFPQTRTWLREVSSNGAILKSISGELYPKVSVNALTNNVSSLTVAGQSLCRVGPGCIDDTAVAWPSVYASFNPRAGTVSSSPDPIGFV